MERWFGGYLAVGFLVVAVATLPAWLGTAAQDGAEGNESTAVAGGPAPTTGTPAGDTILFQANAETGFADWTEGYFGGSSNQFTERDGMLGAAAGGLTVLYAPYLTASPDYVLEVEVRLVPPPGTPEADVGISYTIAGLAARYKDAPFGEPDEGYMATTQGTGAILVAQPVETLAANGDLAGAGLPDARVGWHLYRLEVRGDQLRFLIDGVPVAEATDARFTGFGTDGRVGVVASLGPIEVRAFRVLAWE
jgi:hypothetical protein